jgi:hypothetical protein
VHAMFEAFPWPRETRGSAAGEVAQEDQLGG